MLLGKIEMDFKTCIHSRFKKTNFKTQSYAGDMVVRFKTNKKKNDIGAQCRMECVKDADVTTEAPTTPFTEPTTTTGRLKPSHPYTFPLLVSLSFITPHNHL